MCVSKYEGIYHRVFIRENHVSKCVITYVDLGLTEEVHLVENQFKRLLNYFAQLPCLAIPCYLMDIQFKPDNKFSISNETHKKLYNILQPGPFSVEICGKINDVLNVKIFDDDQYCLNDTIVNRGLAV